MATMRPPEKKIDGSSVTGMEMTSSSLSALVARLRVRGGDRGAARRGWVRPVCGCAAGPVAARGVCAARPGRREHERCDRQGPAPSQLPVGIGGARGSDEFENFDGSAAAPEGDTLRS